MKRVDRKIEKKVMELWKSGMGATAISREVGIARGTVYKIVRRLMAEEMIKEEAKRLRIAASKTQPSPKTAERRMKNYIIVNQLGESLSKKLYYGRYVEENVEAIALDYGYEPTQFIDKIIDFWEKYHRHVERLEKENYYLKIMLAIAIYKLYELLNKERVKRELIENLVGAMFIAARYGNKEVFMLATKKLREVMLGGGES